MSPASPRRCSAEGIEAGEIGDAVIASSLAQAARAVAPARADERGAETRRRQHQARRRRAGRARAGIHRPRQSARRADDPRRAARAVRPSRRRQHPLQCEPAASMDRAVFLANWEALNAAVHEIVLDLGGSISAEHGIGRLKRDLLRHAKHAARARDDAQDQARPSTRTASSIPASCSE